jgi:alkylhydroperoxidase family enzyme
LPAKEATIVSDPAKRQQQIVGRPPRIAPLKATEIGEEARAIVARIRGAAGAPATAEVPAYVATFLKHPVLYEKHVALGTELLGNPTLATRHRELAVLRTAWLLGAPYEWGEHVAIGRRAGLIDAEVERITRGSQARGWSLQDRSILRAAEELRENAMISDRTWASLAGFLDELQLIELTYVIGNYTKVAYLQNSLRLRLGEGNPGLAAR